MPIEFNCPHCSKFLSTPEDKAGVEAQCPGCGEQITIPGAGTPLSPQNPALPDALAGSSPWAEPGGTKTCPTCGEEIKVVAIVCRFCGEKLQGSSQRIVYDHTPPGMVPHRGSMIMALGISGLVASIFSAIGVFCCLLFTLVGLPLATILGGLAWSFGNQDLEAIAAGRMDPAGYESTSTGRTLGKVSVILGGIGLVFAFGLMIVLGVLVAMEPAFQPL